ncbi:hypothetical protein [Motilimonas sp. KMU-193]|uniref:hypothetical protein n=1 Tax=Motilimonas sp. KMU-193 TaxID=3388668 RepID=UPI00396B290A
MKRISRYIANSPILTATLLTCAITASLCVAWSLYETRVLGYDMFGDLFPAIIFGAIGAFAALPFGIIIGLILKHRSRIFLN